MNRAHEEFLRLSLRDWETWIDGILANGSALDEQRWDFVLDVLYHHLSNANKRRDLPELTRWATVYCRICQELRNPARAIDDPGRHYYLRKEANIRSLTAISVSLVGAYDPEFNPPAVRDWILTQVDNGFDYYFRKSVDWQNKDIKEIAELRRLKNLLNALAALVNHKLIPVDGKITRWLELRDNLP